MRDLDAALTSKRDDSCRSSTPKSLTIHRHPRAEPGQGELESQCAHGWLAAHTAVRSIAERINASSYMAPVSQCRCRPRREGSGKYRSVQVQRRQRKIIAPTGSSYQSSKRSRNPFSSAVSSRSTAGSRRWRTPVIIPCATVSDHDSLEMPVSFSGEASI